MLQFSSVSKINDRESADLIVFPFWEGEKKPREAHALGSFEQLAEMPISLGDFKGKQGEVLLLYLPKGSPKDGPKNGKEQRCALLGLGKEEKISIESLRLASAALVKQCQKKKLTRLNFVLPTVSQLRNIKVDDLVRGIVEGALLSNYSWNEKSEPDDSETLIKSLAFIGLLAKNLHVAKECQHIAEAVYLARDLINGSADVVTPAYLVKTAKKIASKFPVLKATILEKPQLVKEKFGLLLSVGRGSPHDPALIVLSYQGAPKSKEHTVVVGKGITYDTGGLNIKPGTSMNTMRDDMSGAAAALATVAASAALGLKVNVTAVVATAENSVDGMSYKPGDVYKSYLGKTVEIGDTDAEGRLTLADALAYSVQNLKPTRLVDLATLTGSVVVALGEEIAGLYSNNDALSADLQAASTATSEIIFRMPLHMPYKELLKSDIADLKNVGGRAGGSIIAALFLQEFVGNIPWAHIDIAGTAFNAKPQGYNPKNGVGFGVRLLVEDLKRREK